MSHPLPPEPSQTPLTTSGTRRRRFRPFRLFATSRPRNPRQFVGHQQYRGLFLAEVDGSNFDWVIVLIAGAGFLTGAYDIFAINMTIPMISHVYYHGDMPHSYEAALRTSTLVGTIIGQVGFGLLADVYGRRRIYGLELVTVIIGTLGEAMGSRGESSMVIIGWLIFWRVIMGIGIGADYPLSAVLTSEWAPTRHRAQMLACVFFAQPLGYFLASVAALGWTVHHKGRIPTDPHVLSCSDDAACRSAVDSTWRWIIGFGAVPAALAVLARFWLEESPMYTMDVLNRPMEARSDYYEARARDLPANNLDPLNYHQPNGDIALDNTGSGPLTTPPEGQAHHEGIGGGAPRIDSRWAEFWSGFRHYFKGHWGILLGTSLSWLIFDTSFYALGANSFKIVAKLFASAPLKPRDGVLPRSIYQDLFENSWHSLVVVSIGSILGGIIMIFAVRHGHPRDIQTIGFLVLTVLFIALGLLIRFLKITHDTSIGPILLYIFCEIFFELGPNFTTFIIPAQLFPTRYRCTAHGISAASGKVGAVLIQLVVQFGRLDGRTSAADTGTKWLGDAAIIFGGVMLLGAVVTILLVPKTHNLTFQKAEELPNLPPEGQRVQDFVIGMIRAITRLFRAETGASQGTT